MTAFWTPAYKQNSLGKGEVLPKGNFWALLLFRFSFCLEHCCESRRGSSHLIILSQQTQKERLLKYLKLDVFLSATTAKEGFFSVIAAQKGSVTEASPGSGQDSSACKRAAQSSTHFQNSGPIGSTTQFFSSLFHVHTFRAAHEWVQFF